MEDSDLGHPLTFGAFCDAFWVVSAEIWVFWPIQHRTILYKKNKMGVIPWYIFVVISTIFPLYFTKTICPPKRERRERSPDKIDNDDGVFRALLGQSEGDQSHHQHYQHPLTRPPQWYRCGFISQVVSLQNKGTSQKRTSELSFKEGTSSCKKICPM